MAKATFAPVIPLVQPKRPRTAAERQRAYRERQRQKQAPQLPAVIPPAAHTAPTQPAFQVVQQAELSKLRTAAPLALRLAALALAGTGIVMNGAFAMSLGSTDRAGWLFLALGLASDVAALAIPSCAARLWQDGERGTAMAGWLIWATVFAFALLSGLGFASVNISDVTLSRASRTSPAMVAAQTALTDAMASRDRECRGGVGKFCREREAAVADLRTRLDAAMAGIAQTADPQTEAAVRLVTWLSRGAVTPTGNDFAMLRLILLALLPQVGGVLLMVGRTS